MVAPGHQNYRMNLLNAIRARRPLAALTLLLLLSTGCVPAAVTQSASPVSYWGEIITLAQAEQTHAPALWVEPGYIAAAWIGADEAGVHHDMRVVGTPIAVLPLPPVHPYAQQLAPAQADNLHLLWLDADEGGETRLFAALISPERTVARGPTMLSDRLTLRYTFVPNGDGSLWAVWSGEPVAEPVLYAQFVDSLGRPRQPIRWVENADWPVMTWTNRGIYLYWLQPTSGQVHRARMAGGTLADEQFIVQGVTLGDGDRLTGFSAAADHTHSYLFWNITRADGRFETWWSTSPLDTAQWSEPQRLGVDWTTKVFIETGFNGGRAFPARAGEKWLSWAAPVSGQLETLPVAVQQGNKLALVYFRNGELLSYQNIARSVSLIGPPALMTDRDLHLYLAWSQPTPAGYANLLLTTTEGNFQP